MVMPYEQVTKPQVGGVTPHTTWGLKNSVHKFYPRFVQNMWQPSYTATQDRKTHTRVEQAFPDLFHNSRNGEVNLLCGRYSLVYLLLSTENVTLRTWAGYLYHCTTTTTPQLLNIRSRNVLMVSQCQHCSSLPFINTRSPKG